MAHPLRLAILDYISNGEQCVCDIAEYVDSERSNVSRHLAVMLSAGIVQQRKDGLNVLYSLKTPCVLKFLAYSVLGLSKNTHLGLAVEFFLFEVPKVLLLLTIIVFAIGIIRTYFTPQRTRKFLSGKKQGIANVLAALLGVVTPFCSCSAIPLFIGFVAAGIPLGVTFSFLISAPMVNETPWCFYSAYSGGKWPQHT